MEPRGRLGKLRGALLHSIVWKLLVPTPILVALGLILIIAIVPPMIEYNVRQAARDAALEKVQQFRTVRNLTFGLINGSFLWLTRYSPQ